jgi:hypothetical protein
LRSIEASLALFVYNAHVPRQDDLQGIVAAAARRGFRLEQRDALAQHLRVSDPLTEDRNEIPHDVCDRAIDTEKIGVESVLRNPIANLASKAGYKLVFSDSIKDSAKEFAEGFQDRKPCS